MEAEDLDVANILTSDFTSDQDRFEGKLSSESGNGRLIYVNQEFRNHEPGHLCLLNLKKLIEPVKEVRPHHHPLHLIVCDEVHRQGGYVSWAHFPSWPGIECPLDVAMEKLDGLEILCVLEPRDFPTFMKHVVPEHESNDGLRLWYRYLNCGFRLTATAGTDKMTTFVTVGANRVFAQVEGELTYQGWIDALKAGRTFITNSPILSFTINGHPPGISVPLSSKRRKPVVEIEAAAESQLPYHHLEIVCNGRVIAEATPSGSKHRARIRLEHPVHQSCWIAARAFEDIQSYRAKGLKFSTVHIQEGTLHGNYFGTRRPETVFAHTSPVYLITDGRPIRSWDDAQYYVRFLDRAIQWLRTEAKFAKDSDKRSSIEAFQTGRTIFQRRAEEAGQPGVP
ncbi:MAG: CehA/McbA family metallohydrolase [Acidobacteria bacterium]|nr:CehA/McbA family metallohydrolase [Acidobacteriota bacterium]